MPASSSEAFDDSCLGGFGEELMISEEERIVEAYRKRHDDATIYSLFNSGQLFMVQQLEKAVIKSLRRHQISSLLDRKVLEVGCGTASPLRRLINYGAKPENLCGIDILQNAVEEAKAINPNMDLRCGNAENLPFDNQSFDVVMQFTVFTSVLKDAIKGRIASEMLRVLKPGGIILWYDYFLSKPTNQDVKGIGKREVVRLFPDCTFDFNKVTLAPPIARAIAPHSFLLCYLLEKMPFLRTHYLVVIKKKTT